ncbi:MAG: gliding motility protein GldN [Candidatus Marinimicrobia bacterium]|nr:gliding motility protein GldN [Candidatus Neomarinimicrobiota bacterium]|tara:strand:+ start:896 stop:1807 length:912 start_codon:yes stop_codon:yes gene_type:complete
MKKIFLITLLIFFANDNFSQANLLNAKNPLEIGDPSASSKAITEFVDYENVEDKNILWSKVVYEFIDLNEKLNFPLLFPVNDTKYDDTRKSLWRIIRENIENGKISEVYDSNNDNFTEASRIIGTDSTDLEANIYKNYNISDIYKSKFVPESFVPREIASSADIFGYVIKGVWYFDKIHAELRYRLLAIQPYGTDLKTSVDGEETETGYFWIWYPSIREILDDHLVFNDKNNNNRVSFDELLINRRFSSYIYKYDNVYGDREIRDYIRQRDNESYSQWQTRIVMESERIKKEILDFEIDMWGY